MVQTGFNMKQKETKETSTVDRFEEMFGES